MKSMWKAIPAVVAGIAAAAAMSGCSSAKATTDSVQAAMSAIKYDCSKPDASKTTTVSISAMPIVSNGAIYTGIDQGFFKKQGLELKINTVASVAASMAAVQGGSTDLAFTGNINLIQALDQGLQMSIVAPFAGIAPNYWSKMQAGVPGYTKEVTGLMVAPDSPIKNPGDLTGKTVAVNDSKGQNELVTRYVIKAHGGDPDKVKFVVMSAADGVNALMAGKVDAANTLEPADLKAEQQGYRMISWPTVETLHDGPTSSFVASNSFIVKNPETVARFNCAMRDATAYGNSHPDEVRAATAKASNVDPKTLATATVPYFYSTTDMSGLQRFEDITKQFGFINKSPDLNSMVIPQARG